MKIRIIQQGDQTFTYDGEDEASLRQALLHEPGVPGIVYDITDLDRSDMDADEYLIATEDDGTPVWSGWLGGVTGPAPGTAGDGQQADGVIAELRESLGAQVAENAKLSRKLAEANAAIVALTGHAQAAAPVMVTWDPGECTTAYIDEIAEAVREQSGGRVIITMTDIADSDCHAVVGPREYTDDEALELIEAGLDYEDEAATAALDGAQ